jgi:hypothetical protein
MKVGDRVIVKGYGRPDIWLNGYLCSIDGLAMFSVQEKIRAYTCDDLDINKLKAVLSRTWSTTPEDIKRKGVY